MYARDCRVASVEVKPGVRGEASCGSSAKLAVRVWGPRQLLGWCKPAYWSLDDAIYYGIMAMVALVVVVLVPGWCWFAVSTIVRLVGRIARFAYHEVLGS